MYKKAFLLFLFSNVLTLSALSLPSEGVGSCSVAGFFPLENSGRLVWNFNAGWRFHLGDVAGAEATTFDDRSWEVVSTPHTIQLMPAEASGCRNYQGIAWYRKRFTLPRECAGRDVTLHFEAIMGRQTIYVNGQLVKQHEGGYLPITIPLPASSITPPAGGASPVAPSAAPSAAPSDTPLAGGGSPVAPELVIAIKADNSDDKTYPPGKKQMTLDFAYHGGIYRDVWLIAKNKVAITDAVEEQKVAGGGLFVHYANISEKSADVYIDTEVRNSDNRPHTVTLEQVLSPATAASLPPSVATLSQRTKLRLLPSETRTVTQHFLVKSPHLWSPESPYLYQIATRIRDGRQSLDGGITRIGIRSFEFRSSEFRSSTTPDGSPSGSTPGFYLNGHRYHQLVGANRHQDFAYVGNALPNSQQWRDAKRLRDAGFTIIRTAHYPQDPSFMDACDELGLFVIVATPGWQYWNKDPGWDEKVHQNTRLIIRRDRNHPCVLMWEPILNETRYPEAFALQALQITKDEYPYPYRPVAAADMHSAGVLDHYDVVYGWPGDDFKALSAASITSTTPDGSPSGTPSGSPVAKQPIFTREFGELVDDWYAHNNLNRASRSWGERPMLTQAMSLSRSTDELFHTTGQFIGGCQWHPFDHQRGYHPDPYWGGIYDAFRQPKTALSMFRAKLIAASQQPIVTIAHEMTQFSDPDVTVFSNCDSVRLTMYDGEHCWTLPVPAISDGSPAASASASLPAADGFPVSPASPSAAVVFPDAWNFFEARDWSYTKRSWQQVKMVAEGIINGKVVCRDERMPSRRSTKLRLRVDDMDRPLVADGSDFVVVVCEVTDDLGHVRRLAKENIRFTVEGEGQIIGDERIGANPRAVEWGSAPILIRSTRQAGRIKIRAEVQYPGIHAPSPAEITLQSFPAPMPAADGSPVSPTPQSSQLSPATTAASVPALSDAEKARMLQEVEAQQADFGIQK